MGRRGNGEGSIRYRKKEKRWEGCIMVGYQSDGRRKRTWRYGPTRKACLEKMQKVKADRDNGQDLDARYSFEEAAMIWLQHKTKITPATARNYEFIVRTLSDGFADRAIREIKPIHIEDVLNRLAERGYSSSYLTKCVAVLNMVFRKCHSNGWVATNPVPMIERVGSQVESKSKEPFSEDQVALMMKDLPADHVGHAIRFLLGTGLRLECLLALEPAMISDDGSEVFVCQAAKSDGKGGIYIGGTKTGSKRTVPVPREVRASALYLKEHADGRFIFTSPKNCDLPIVHSTFRKQYQRVMRSIGISDPGGPHRLRHTYASLLIRAGVDPVTVSKLCGHSTPRITLEVYTHAMQSAMLEAADRLSELFGEAS